ncbi:MAG: phosphate--AMP phosphotransferase [Lachnospiraceae bacterium]|nr:phosphate--AMP phosphotransferase [Lachnospiraceae bacterium]
MLEKVDLNRKMGKKEYKTLMDDLQPKLSYLQRACKEAKIPVIVIFEGLGAAGKGTLINHLIEPLDPRGFQVYTTAVETKEERMKPFLWRFWTKIPSKGRIAVFDRSWYRRVLVDRFDGVTSKEQLDYAFEEIASFEKQLTDDGMVLIKFFAHISQKEQKKRLEHLCSDKKTAWRVTKDDLKRNKEYDRYLTMNEEMLERTDFEYAPWNILECTDREYASAKMTEIVVSVLEQALAHHKAEKVKKQEISVEPETQNDAQPGNGINLATSVLAGVDLSKTLEKEEYKKKLAHLQKRLGELHNELYKYRVPVVLAFEGWDAGGKGGAIKRLTQALDPRGYAVHPVASPTEEEKAHHYLWRFWRNFPKDGHISIFDRSWYGRVMVERIEGFCSTEEWKRAYHEINEMEEQLALHGCIVIKFWMHIDKDEQERRFQERQENPAKQWKITEEDWRNRAKWDQYETAVDEMLLRTSTTYAPWVIVEANSKYYARVKVLETVINAIEAKLNDVKKK